MKTVIQVWTQTADCTNIDTLPYWGLGDLIRGTIKLYQLSQKMNFRLIVNISLHPLSKNLKIQTSDYDDFIFLNKDNIKYVMLGCLEQYIKSSTEDILYFLTTEHCDENDISEECKEFIKNILKPDEKLSNLLETFLSLKDKKYEIVHARLGDGYINNNVTEESMNKIDNIVDKYYTQKDIFMCDSKYYKEHLKDTKPHVCILDLDICHIGRETDETKIKNTMLEFFIISKSNRIKTYSNYFWISGFVFWLSKIYDIDILNIKNIDANNI
jgi:hypothetical protein